MTPRSLLLPAVAAFATLLALPNSGSAQSILKTAGNYAALGGQGLTVAGTGFTITNGNVGIFPAATSNITGFPPGTVSGLTLGGSAATIVLTGAATGQAQADLQVAATGLAGMAMSANYSTIDLANLGPLPPGVYRWNAAATMTGALVLDAQGRNNVFWVFQFGTGLTTAVNSSVRVINPGSNGGSDDGIFWNAATGAIVIGDNNTVLGNYIAYTSVSFSGSTLLIGNGGARFLALNAAVTFAGPGALNALGGPGGGDWTGGLTLSGANVVATAIPFLPYARITNFSARGQSGPGGTALTAGFVVAGGGKTILVRGVGPTLATFGIANALADPLLTLTGPNGLIASNSAWQTNGIGQAQGAQILAAEGQVGAFALPSGSLDTAILATVGPGANVVSIVSPNGSSGSALAEIYDDDTTPRPVARIINASVLTSITSGQGIFIAGLVIVGNIPQTVLIRGVGPTLASFGVPGTLPDPRITVLSGSNQLATNAGWGNAAQVTAADGQVGAFPLASGSLDSALVLTLQPGAYSIEVTSASNATGAALVEVYDTQ
jgi:hypothetical protein